ncbi:MAG: hypothetical protein H9W81_12395 [Enterococcus sp.]|nr:hypothetical protein [Enterococcus sp.]
MSENTAHTGDQKVGEFISAASKNPVKAPTDKIIHKYKWTGEEKTIVGTLFVAAVVLAVVGLVAGNIAAYIGAGVVLVLGALVTRLGLKRKSKSRLIALFDSNTGILSVEGNGLSASHNNGNLNTARNLFVKKVAVRDENIDPKDFLGISFGGSKKMMIPMRLVAQEPLLGILTPYIEKQSEIRGSDKLLEAFLEAAKIYKG